MRAPGLGFYLLNASLELCIHLAYDNSRENIVYSPFSIGTTLSMVLAGARGNTALELSNLLHVDAGYMNTRYFSEAINNSLSSRDVICHTANRLYSDRTFPVRSEYARLLYDKYKARILSVDFQSNSEAVRHEANEWVSRKTQNKIRNLLGPDSVSSETLFILLSAIYFEASWQSSFSPEQTNTGIFYMDSYNIVYVDMMNQESDFMIGHSDELNCRALEMPYRGGEYSMVILLPDSVDGLSSLEERLTEYSLANAFIGLKMRRVRLSLPKFKVEQKLTLKDTLRAIGVNDLFDDEKVDLSRMFENRGPAVTAVYHHALVEVNENGTKAAAATTALGSNSFYVPGEATSFIVDHPFMFFIKRNEYDLILFMGSVRRPV
ncbi:hypothetical protein V5799_026326 [Amblyomma americanum]|uniref:Serpin domain-containing protein n=1 Tax=Amblyomma americanum TaxID=6943 RepID=A0AAQ4DIX6_AMBAM